MSSEPDDVVSARPLTTVPSQAGASSDAVEPPVKRGRRSNPKVKTGCSTCKQRRIKCDEKRPTCSQCTRGNRTCTGYPPPSRAAATVLDIRIAPKPAVAIQSSSSGLGVLRPGTVLPPRRAKARRRQQMTVLRPQGLVPSPTMYEPSGGLSFKQTDGMYFELFRVQTAAEISGYFNSSFWTQRVLQECHSEVAVRHAVVALGALYKTLEQSCESPTSDEPGAISRMNSVLHHWHVAVRQYSDACNAMLLLTGENLASHRARLMASILLACFDSFIGDHKQAIVQIQTGLRLLERIQTNKKEYRSSSPDGRLENDIVVIFTRLAIQAKSYDMAFHFPQPYVIRLAPHAAPGSATGGSESSPPNSPQALSIPFQFITLEEARHVSDKLCEMLLRFIERLQLAKNDPSNVLPSSWKQYGLRFKEQLNAWAVAFDPILQSRMALGANYRQKAAIAALKMFQINTNILFLMMFCDTEVQFDAFVPHFKDIVDLGWEVVVEDEKRAAAARCPNPESCQHQHGMSRGPSTTNSSTSNHVKPSFSADLGIVPPLFVVATKCRDRKIRRQAIQLLRSSARREGMWDSELAAKIGQWVMQVEESGDSYHGQDVGPEGYFMGVRIPASLMTLPKEPIPEEKRVMVKSVDFDLRARFAELRVGTRALHDGSQDGRSQKTRITW